MSLFEEDFIPQTNGKFYVGIDNGVSGTIAIIKPNGEVYMNHIPVKKELSFTKKKQFISRLDGRKLIKLFQSHIPEGSSVHVRIERPMMQTREKIKAMISGLRCLEAVLIIVEDVMNYPYGYIDSREWQRALLPSGLQGPELKHASLQIGNRLFPQFRDFKHPDRDGLLIAEYARRTNL